MSLSGDRDSSKGGVLIVDDDPDLVQLFCILLSESGYEVFNALNTEKATSTLEEHYAKIDAILIDIVLRGTESGVDIYLLVKESYPDIKPIMMSGHRRDHLEEKYQLPTDAFLLKKPFGFEELIDAIHSPTGGSRNDSS